MAQPKPRKKVPASSTTTFRGFLNIQLSDADRATIKATKYEDNEHIVDLDKWIDSGFKFTFSYDDYSHCFQCIGTRYDKDHEDYGILLSGRGSTVSKSFKQWLYIQTRLVGDTPWWQLLEAKAPVEIDD